MRIISTAFKALYFYIYSTSYRILTDSRLIKNNEYINYEERCEESFESIEIYTYEVNNKIDR